MRSNPPIDNEVVKSAYNITSKVTFRQCNEQFDEKRMNDAFELTGQLMSTLFGTQFKHILNPKQVFHPAFNVELEFKKPWKCEWVVEKCFGDDKCIWLGMSADNEAKTFTHRHGAYVDEYDIGQGNDQIGYSYLYVFTTDECRAKLKAAYEKKQATP